MSAGAAPRPHWMTALALFCAATVAFLAYRDLFVASARDVEVWFGFELRGAAARATAPLHWALFAFGAWAAWRDRRWIAPAAAVYAWLIAASHLVWNLASPGGGGLGDGLWQALLFATPGVALWIAHRRRGRACGVGRLVSGGQTGADRAALEVAAELGLATGGWVPRGRRAEDGAIPQRHRGLVETESDDYAPRTERNVRDADATLVVAFGAPRGGSALSVECAQAQGRPLLVLDLAAATPETAASRLRAWLDAVRPRVLNVAGPRASEQPRIHAATAALLRAALAARR